MSSIRLKRGMWVVVADGEKALFLKNEGDATYPDLNVVRKIEEENPPTREQGTDRPGRYSDGPTVHRSAVTSSGPLCEPWPKAGATTAAASAKP